MGVADEKRVLTSQYNYSTVILHFKFHVCICHQFDSYICFAKFFCVFWEETKIEAQLCCLDLPSL